MCGANFPELTEFMQELVISINAFKYPYYNVVCQTSNATDV